MECPITLNNQSISQVLQFENSPLQGVHVERGLVAAQHDADEDPQIANVLLRHHAPWQVTVVHIIFFPVFLVVYFSSVFYFFSFSFFPVTLFMEYNSLTTPPFWWNKKNLKRIPIFAIIVRKFSYRGVREVQFLWKLHYHPSFRQILSWKKNPTEDISIFH